MEKKKRHYSLEVVKQLVVRGNWMATKTALVNAWADFNYLEPDIRKAILGLDSHDFYKSMTAHYDSSQWQDVYRPMCKGRMSYIKVSLQDNHTVVIQFKGK